VTPRRRALLPGVYVVLVSLPAALAVIVDPFSFPIPPRVEISVALGLTAVPIVLMQFGLLSRIRAVSRWLSTDTVARLHQYGGLLGLVLILGHVLLLNLEWLPLSMWLPTRGPRSIQMGAIAFWSFALLTLTTVCRRRLHLSHELWRALHLVLAGAGSVAMFFHLSMIQGYTRSTSMRVLIGVFLLGAAAVTLDYRMMRPLRLGERPWEVVSNRDDGADTRTLRLRPVGHPGLEFHAGQFAWLITGRSPFAWQQHPLFFSSSPERTDGRIEFSIKALGDWSSQVVPLLGAGTRVWLDGAFGSFTPDLGSLRPLVLVAGDIGIAPMRSILLALRDRQEDRHVHLIYAACDESRVAFTPELESLRRSLHLNVVYVFEHPSSTWAGYRGSVTAELLRATLKEEAARSQCFVCGPVPMLSAVERALVAAGVPAASIRTERFCIG
jgi:predicted ferric reductase